jgi:uncharacterized membrane protein YccC
MRLSGSAFAVLETIASQLRLPDSSFATAEEEEQEGHEIDHEEDRKAAETLVALLSSTNGRRPNNYTTTTATTKKRTRVYLTTDPRPSSSWCSPAPATSIAAIKHSNRSRGDEKNVAEEIQYNQTHSRRLSKHIRHAERMKRSGGNTVTHSSSCSAWSP